ncbi:MAG: glycosyltransferase [Eubacterium sp.]|nr:glycosyltransferase [Eubacterium sp.]MCM1303148.1 glycosyltransferase [Butyrivibrio sp.]MCM1344251.1 glycosyltransferase [Muribaculaceae bacterium]MCM1409463.1 glycosyltransferase [Lachnospiraceae bacterium]
MGEKTILSISLLASNRKETIRKCLDSLLPIMEKVSSELIIVDTGCDAETQAILREYTDHIIPFVWCDDFSKARNAGLKEAKGEWFMFIDDDEWFLDVRDIVDFFVKGEYKEYGLANYIVRNFTNIEGTEWDDCWVTRMIRRTAETRFRSRIHEYMDPAPGNLKLLKSTAGHFGYIFDSQEKLYRHAQRNITRLLEMLEEEPDNTRWWTQLAQEYKGIREYHRMYELCREGIGHFKEMDTALINRDRGTFYAGCVMADLIRGLWEEAVKDYEEAIEDSRNTEACQAVLQFNGAVAYLKGERYEEAARCCRSYLKTYKRLKGDDMELLRQGTFFVRDSFEEENRVNVCAHLIISECRLGKDMALKQYFKKFAWKEEKMYFNYDLIPALIDFWAGAEYDEFYTRAAEFLMGRGRVDKVTIDCLCTKETVAPEEDFLRLARIFSFVKSDHPFIRYLRILYQDSCGNYSDIQDNLKELLERQEDFLCLPDKLWSIVERGGIDLKGLFHRMDFDQWKTGVDLFVQKSDIDTILKRKEMWFGAEVHDSLDALTKPETAEEQASPDFQADVEAAALRREYFMLRTTEALLIKEHYNNSYEELHQALLEYVDGNLKLYGAFFNDNAFLGEMAFLPCSCRLAVKLGPALSQERDGDHIAVLEAYKDCLQIYPAMNSVIRQYAHLYREKMEAETQEFARLKEQLLEKARELIGAQAYEGAGLILGQLEQLIPGDPDILALEDRVRMKNL